MAALVHGCGSPRQHHGSNIPCSNMTGSHHKHQTVIYPTMPKYSRSSIQKLATPSHHYVYGGSNSTPGHQYNPSLPPVTYLPVGVGVTSQQQQSQHLYSPAQRPTSISATTADCRNYWAHPHAATMMYRSGRHHSKRKSAVELLAETKPFYVKSDTVFERIHQTSYRTSTIASGSKRGRNSVDIRDESRCKVSYGETDMEHRYATSTHMHSGNRNAHVHHHHHHSHHPPVGRNSVGSSNNLLQSKLRVLLSNEASRERNVSSTRAYRNELPRNFGTGKGASGSCTKEPSTVPFESEGGAEVHLPPPSFLSPQPFDNVHNYPGENSSGDEPLVLTENYRPISPPAEYAADSCKPNIEQRSSRYNYQRSYSHSHEMAAENSKYTSATYNINSHKSLPDLHSQISRHSPHSEILSCCSRGNRSIKSAGESSLNRDSGGSSGHYTHRSEPCYRQRECDRDIYGNQNCCNMVTTMEFRRDSGSSTQHSANSYCGGYASPSYSRNAECNECRCKNNARFESSDYLFNFATPEVPEAFQDNYDPHSPPSTVPKYKTEEPRYSSSSSQQLFMSPQPYTGGAKPSQIHTTIQSPGSAPSVDDISPPPIQFKRQRCIRFKNRNRVALANTSTQQSRNANDIGETYHQRQPADQQQAFFPKCFSAETYSLDKSFVETPCSNDIAMMHNGDYGRESGLESDISDLEKFFDRLGLNDDKFHEIYSPSKRRRSAETDSDDSSTVFFSDVSTVDSMRLPDSTETQPQTSQSYRPSEPPSIVERNARIIKWLCNCRKLQYS